MAIARLHTPANLGRTSQEVWFIILVVTSTKEVRISDFYQAFKSGWVNEGLGCAVGIRSDTGKRDPGFNFQPRKLFFLIFSANLGKL